MARVYSTRLSAGIVEAGSTTVYSVPASMKAVMLDGAFTNVGDVDAQLTLEFRPLGGGLLPVHNFGTNNPDGDVHWEGRVVLNAGDSIVLTTDGEYSHVISGYLFLV
jgi:hypothetical protein